MNLSRRATWLVCLIAAVVVSVSPSLIPSVMAGTPAVYTASDKLAVSGYDAVAYFTEGKATKGSAEFSLLHQGVAWRFSSAANRATFQAAPSKYAPQYGGHCAWAISQGYTASADPKVWKIVDGKLYLNFNTSVGRNWEKSAADNITRADENWPKLLAK